jgi:phage terminase large subunit-like protein
VLAGFHGDVECKVGFDLAEKPDATAISLVQVELDGSQRVVCHAYASPKALKKWLEWAHKSNGDISPELLLTKP